MRCAAHSRYFRPAIAILAFIVASPAYAQGAPTMSSTLITPAADAWQFEATPYFWAAGMSGWGRIGSRTPTVKFDPSFSDIWKNLDFGAMGSFEARKGRWGILFDSIYVKLGQESDPLLRGDLGTAKLKVSQTILQLAGAYRVYDSPVTPIDVLAGVRYTYLDSDLSFSKSRLLPDGTDRSNHVDWTDGFVGVRGAYYLTDKWSLIGYADVGGGGTDYSWQLAAGTNYEFTKSLVGKLGYRIISMKYETSNFLYDVKTEGVYIGLGIRF
jgi:opacity protein-like surface antigen